MEPSTVGFKHKSADLHNKSPKIFAASLLFSAFLTAIIINISYTNNPRVVQKVERAPFVINMEKIPETNRSARPSAPSKPFLDSGMPIEVDDDIMPEEISIEEPISDFDIAAESSQALPGAETGEPASTNFSVSEEIPKKLNNIIPDYPEMAERAGVEGAVTLKVLVGVTGSVDSVEVEDGPKIFIESAIDAAKRTRFTPAKYNGEPVASWVYMPFRFMLDD
ncbi:energy transducer TonB [Candidatus Latescibacterota bacterium]